jgi:hypothetical protein
MTGRRYLLGDTPVTVVTAYNARTKDLPPAPTWLHWQRPPKAPPRNVAIQHPDGRIVVRTFRGLRNPAQ